MGDREVELKETPPAAADTPPSPPVSAVPPRMVEESVAETGSSPQAGQVENLPRGGRRVSSIEPVKGAPPPKRASVVVFETPDTPPAQKYVIFQHSPHPSTNARRNEQYLPH
ncbi:unnamed protein product [Strongylus vulgaris]|uniref:Uncharacterized protein n=1 Tax=Strongylus vulgaris TaxID=40348 RepID=A0A3P7JBB6_STRVU|nr:unnamed protein product [Strongylus vulgaris]